MLYIYGMLNIKKPTAMKILNINGIDDNDVVVKLEIKTIKNKKSVKIYANVSRFWLNTYTQKSKLIIQKAKEYCTELASEYPVVLDEKIHIIK